MTSDKSRPFINFVITSPLSLLLESGSLTSDPLVTLNHPFYAPGEASETVRQFHNYALHVSTQYNRWVLLVSLNFSQESSRATEDKGITGVPVVVGAILINLGGWRTFLTASPGT